MVVKLNHTYLQPYFRHMSYGDLDINLVWFWERFTVSYEFVITLLCIDFNFSNTLIILIPFEYFAFHYFVFLCNYSLLWMSKMGDCFTDLKPYSFNFRLFVSHQCFCTCGKAKHVY